MKIVIAVRLLFGVLFVGQLSVDIAAFGRAEWQFAHHFGMTMGYGGWHFSKSDTVARKTLTLSPTLNGLIFGFGIYF